MRASLRTGMITLTGKVTLRGLGCRSCGSSSVCMVGVKGLKTYYRRIWRLPYDRKDDSGAFISDTAVITLAVDGL